MIKKIIKFILPSKIINFIHKEMNRRINSKKFKDVFFGKNVRITNNCFFEKGVKIYDDVSLNNVYIGKYTYFAPNSKIHMVNIGKYCSIGPNVNIGIGMHPTKDIVSTHPSFFSIKKQSAVVYADKNYFEEISKINIGNDVWIGMNVIIKDGVSIGNGAIIGAGAMVSKNVPPYAIVGGVPAKLIRYRFSNEEIKFLENFKWWNKPDEWVKNNWRYFLDIKKFIQKNLNK